MTEYQKEKFGQITNLKFNVWYDILPNRPDKSEFIEMIKLYIDLHGYLLEFNGDYTKFRRTDPLSIEDKGVKFEFHKMEDVSFDYSHLPENKLPFIDSKAWGKLKGRSI